MAIVTTSSEFFRHAVAAKKEALAAHEANKQLRLENETLQAKVKKLKLRILKLRLHMNAIAVQVENAEADDQE